MPDAEQIVHEVAERVREVLSQAEEKATQIVREAEEEARRIRERAETEGKDRLEEVRKALGELEGKLSGPRAEIAPGPVVVPEPEPQPVPEPQPPPVPEPTPPPDEGTLPEGTDNGDAAAARLVAMNMALDGAAREAIETHLAENYSLDDVAAIVDDVLALAAK